VSSGRYLGATTSSGSAISIFKPAATVTPEAYVEWETVLQTTGGVAGLTFDYYGPNDYKYATLDPSTGLLTLGHRAKKKFVVDQQWTVSIAAGVDQKLMLALNGTSVTISLNGTVVGSYSYNGDVVDGQVGLFTQSGAASFDNTRSQVGTHVINAVDPVPPTLNMPADVTRSTDAGKTTAFVSDSTLGTATATDNVQVQSVVRSGVPAGNIFPLGTTTITWTATDVFGNVTTKTQKVTIVDTVAPTLNVPGNVVVSIPASASSAVVSDAQLGTATASDNSGSVTLTRSGVPAGNVFLPGTTTITYTAVDAAGNTKTATQTVTVLYPAMALSMPANQSGSEGTAATFSLGSFTGGGGSWTVSVNWGDGTTSTLATQPGSMSADHTYANDRSTPYTVSVTVTDADGRSVGGTFTIAVANVAPTVKINTPGPGSNLAWKTSYSFKASFSDPGTVDTHTCTITWGDGSSSTGTVNEATDTCTSSHSWSATGNYTITVTLRDNAGATATATSAIMVTKAGGTVFTVLSYTGAKTLKTKVKHAAVKQHAAKAKKHAAKKKHAVKRKHAAAKKRKGKRG
jgi:hypothetical protein